LVFEVCEPTNEHTDTLIAILYAYVCCDTERNVIIIISIITSADFYCAYDSMNIGALQQSILIHGSLLQLTQVVNKNYNEMGYYSI